MSPDDWHVCQAGFAFVLLIIFIVVLRVAGG
jgi:hypothetical protein